MSGRLVTAVIDSALPRALKPIAMALASFAADDGTGVRPSRARLAWGLGITERHAQRAIGKLVAMGVLERVQRARPGFATVCIFVAAKLPTRPTFSPRQRALPLEAVSDSETGDTGVPHPEISTAADNLCKTPPEPTAAEAVRGTSTHQNGGHLCADGGHPCVRDPERDPPGTRTTDAGAPVPVIDRFQTRRRPPALAPPPGFAQVVQLVRSVRIEGLDLASWTEDAKAEHVAQGFGYDNQAIRRAQAAIEHVDPPPAAEDPGLVERRQLLDGLRRTVLKAPGPSSQARAPWQPGKRPRGAP